MMSITVNVPDNQQDAVNSWQDGQTYDIQIKQTGPAQFDLVSTGSDEAGEDATASGGGDMESGQTDNPAVALIMAGKKK